MHWLKQCKLVRIQNIWNSFIQLLDFVKPICLPYGDAANEDYHFDADGERQQTWVAGWGVTDVKGKFLLYWNCMLLE